jgi:hypothetical protein
MEKFNKYDFLNSPLMNSEEMNFILTEPSLDEMASSQAKRKVKTEMVDILREDATGVLLLPFFKPDYR